MFDNEQEQQQPCVICNQPHQQMLMLSCIHDPCINCAATHYIQNQPHHSPMYTCSKCGQETELDKTSIVELQKIYYALKNTKKNKITPSSSSYPDKPEYKDNSRQIQYREYEKPPLRTRNDALMHLRQEQTPAQKTYPPAPVSQPSYPTATKKMAYQPTYPCSEHQQEQLTYFCFTCNRPICPECAIHGPHKDHELQTTRKAIKQIKHLLIEGRQKLDLEMSEMASNRQQAKKFSKEWAEQNKQDQEFIKKKLSQLKSIINQKQKQLLRSTDNNLQRNCQILRNQAVAADKTIETIVSIKRSIDNTLKKEDLSVLQEFTKRDEEILEAGHVADREREKFREQQTKNPLRCADLTLLDENIDRIIADLQGLKLTTTVPK